ncbi:diguanylate cyclase [Frankia sp. AgB1.9]|nr:diguanylate cyclase [Frankia sp. AgW1.1]MBL7549203.1 diguanylate cyclase [Frankia sp. AgB1.9]MBL7619420.1 diguanylate cyclase [Frankia sp. AgB1.8]
MLLHETERTRISRLVLPTGPVIRKEPLGPDAPGRLRHEREILDRLAGLPGISQLARDGSQAPPDAILLVDVGGAPLSERTLPLDPAELLTLAERLAQTLAGMHRRGVVHRDVNPTNVIVTTDPSTARRRTADGLAAGDTPYLIDFALAGVVEASEVRSAPPMFSGHREIVGTVPYLAPELTGRTGRPVDQRADLYALGATLYELATGAPPFGSGDPVRVLHDHRTRAPTPPSALNPKVSPELSGILLHLLEKEPDDRYQSADGLEHDLAELRSGGRVARPGRHDVPARPLTPSRLVGRDEEIGDLRQAFDDVMAGRCSGVLLSGVSGVGKTSLADELRPIVAAHGGWFVAGKFDQYRRDQEYDGVRNAFRGLSRLLLAEPEAALTQLRDRLLTRLGATAGLAAAVVPELGALLSVRAQAGDPMTTQARAEGCALGVLRAVARLDRPLVFFVDDLQWAGRTPLGLVDQVFSGAETIEGLLLVCAYREDALDPPHPLTPLLAAWEAQRVRPRRLRLGGLAPAGQAAMLTDLLNLPPASAVELAQLVATSTRGNPYATVELINALRHDGMLSADDGTWRWDRAALRRRRSELFDVDALLTAHVATLPPATRELLVAMACLAGEMRLDLLAVAVGLPPDDVRRRLAPALAGGLVVPAAEDRKSVRFYHDRVRESVLGGVSGPARRDTELALARRLARRPEFVDAAAQQYLRVADAVHEADERRRMGELFRQAAVEAVVLGDYLLAERFLTAAVPLADPADVEGLIGLRTERHAALYCQGRLEEADAEFQAICRLSACPAQRSAATAVQVMSLTNRSRGREAMSLGLGQLRRLGVAVPDPAHLDEEIDRGFAEIYRWIDQTDESADVRGSGDGDDAWQRAVGIVNRLMPTAFFYDQPMMVWLAVNVLRIWARDGPDPRLLVPAGHIAGALITRRADYETAGRVMRRILDVARAGADEAEGWEAELWDARFLYAVSAGHWFDALEDNLAEARRVLAGLIRVGHLQNACWNYFGLLYNLLDCAPALEDFAAQVDEALALAARTGNPHAEETFQSCRQLASVLRGEVAESTVDELTRETLLAGNPQAVAHMHIARAIAAAILDQPADLARHTAAALPFCSTTGSNYSMAIARVLRALALAARARATEAGERDAALVELADLVAWLTARAADAPANFQHLLRLVEAERAWAGGDFQQAAYTFDLAQHDSQARCRPWHQALILERSARFYLAHGMYEAGRSLLAAARHRYGQWGATAKASQLDWVNPTLCPEPAGAQLAGGPDEEVMGRRSTLATGTIDLLGVVAASQALSSETGIAGLRARVERILSEMTGATGVHLLLRDEDRHRWSVPDGAGTVVPLEAAGRRGLVPSSVVRYAERTHEPVAVADATQDDRFRRDPYFAGLDRCSLSAVPILIRGELRAMLLLENRMIRGAFSTERLEGIMLIAGQLTVSLDNALVYASLERKVTERTRQLAAANQRLEQLSVTDPLTGLANRRRLEDVLGSEWGRSEQQRTPLGLAMIDVDHFKGYNDRFGHTAGDRCLQRVAACLLANVRDTELAARYGGEEFAIVMPDADRDTATRLAGRLCHAVAELAEPHPSAQEAIVTVSVGAASVVPGPDGSVAKLVDLADAALYQAKRDGRGRVSVADP